MTDQSTPVPGERTMELMEQIRQLEARLGNTNRAFGFAAIRDEYPEIAAALFRGRNICKTDFAGKDIAFIDFRGSDLSGCDFAGARIQGARFEFARVSRDKLRHAQDWDVYCRRWDPRPTNREGDLLSPVQFSRLAGERFSLSPHLPELVMLNNAMLGDGTQPTAEEETALVRGRLAIALRPLTNAEISRALGTQVEPDGHRNLRGSYTVHAYIAGINRDPTSFGLPDGSRACLPSIGLLRTLAQTGIPNCTLAADATTIAPADLAIGCNGREFVRYVDSAEQGGAERSGVLFVRRAGSPEFTAELANHEALLRPIFLLGD